MNTSEVVIAVPVFNGREATQRCLEGLVAAQVVAKHRVLIINDASTDLSVAPMLNECSRSQRSRAFEVRHNAVNRGFTWNVNQAIRSLRGDEHLLLLNSDTIVTDGWLDEILDTARTERKIGTVTPFSNNATICSFPDFSREWPMPSTRELQQLAKTLAAHRTPAIDLPTGVGFCMLITRECLNRVGAFDLENFPRGYGEENDFCRRAAEAGFRNVLCANAFVAHQGGQSFNAEKQALMEQGGERLLAKHPNYNALVTDWIARDPVKARREQIKAKLLNA